MKSLFLLLAVFAFGAAGLFAAPDQDTYKPSTQEVRKIVVNVISLQLAAFQAGDLEKAYSFSAKRFRTQFPIERFAQMVKNAYPEIWDNTKAQFGVVRDDGASAVVSVEVSDKAGDSIAYDYFLLHEEPFWRIAGVIRHEPTRPPQA